MPVNRVKLRQYDGTPVEMSPEEVLKESRNNPWYPYPYPYLATVLTEEARPQGIKQVSVTEVGTDCLRCRIIQRYEPYCLDLDKAWAAWRGTMFHYLVERAAPDTAVAEMRLFAPVGDIVFHGKPDLVWQKPDGTWAVVDAKFPKQVPRWDSPYSDHVAQVQCYAYLVRHGVTDASGDGGTPAFGANQVVSSVGLWYYDNVGGFKPLEARRKEPVATKKGAKNPFKFVKRPHVWDDEEVIAYVQPRAEAVVRAREEYAANQRLPPYPPGFDPITAWQHQWSPTALECVQKWIDTGGK